MSHEELNEYMKTITNFTHNQFLEKDHLDRAVAKFFELMDMIPVAKPK